jgi:hypothetical protein
VVCSSFCVEFAQGSAWVSSLLGEIDACARRSETRPTPNAAAAAAAVAAAASQAMSVHPAAAVTSTRATIPCTSTRSWLSRTLPCREEQGSKMRRQTQPSLRYGHMTHRWGRSAECTGVVVKVSAHSGDRCACASRAGALLAPPLPLLPRPARSASRRRCRCRAAAAACSCCVCTGRSGVETRLSVSGQQDSAATTTMVGARHTNCLPALS